MQNEADLTVLNAHSIFKESEKQMELQYKEVKPSHRVGELVIYSSLKSLIFVFMNTFNLMGLSFR